ncbi:MAG TPA: 3D-(3,5/4)-trihydroxycyclohexane-1,2-dione acylhydrolase (decyclizing) [Candidatus Limnocylindrales bacterium]|nr:3D-(3,5/4)-trihydroxycyclohexane-1,2-dione acylhydrolase (decyclizing) [Candidatus Limnocylindrales bacterium]
MTAQRRLTVAQATIEFLAQQRVERDGQEGRFFGGVWGIFGHGNVAGLGEALEAHRGPLVYRQARNEQAMVHAATAYAKRSARLRAYACTTSVGPGATNLVTGAATATVNRLPVLLLPGDVFATRRVRPVLQQLERPEAGDISANDTLRPVSRYWDRIERPEQLLDALPAAMRVLTSPTETGAVTVALPQDVQVEAFDWPARFLEPRVWSVPRPRPDAAALGRAAAIVARAQRPLIVAGGGVIYSQASAALAALAERFGLPVAETQAGKGALPWDHPWNVGPIGPNGSLAANRLARAADVVIVVGSRLSDFTTASRTAWQDPEVAFVSLNVAELDAAKLGSLALVADAREGLLELAAALAARGWSGSGAGYRARVGELRAAWDAEVDRLRAPSGGALLSQAEVIGLVNEASRPEDVVVCAAGGLPGDLLRLWRTVRPGGYHVEYGYSCMGYEVAGGLGVRLAEPASEVWVVVGDGSYLMLSQELATAVQEGLKLNVVLLDNHGFGCIDGLAHASGQTNGFNRFRMRDAGSGELTGPYLPLDLAANARSLGADVLTATDRAGLAAALERSRAAERTTVTVVEVDPAAVLPNYESWWDVPLPEVSASPEVQAARADHERHAADQRWFG